MLLPERQARQPYGTTATNIFSHPRTRPMGIGMDLVRPPQGWQPKFPVEVSLSYVEVEEGTFAIAFVSDISQRKQLEEQLCMRKKWRPWAGWRAAWRTTSTTC